MLAPFKIARAVADAVEACGARYLIGGSLASSMTGEPRSTLDVDMVVELDEGKIRPFLEHLPNDFFADEQALTRAVKEKASTNLFHEKSGIKVDIFVSDRSAIARLQMDRRERVAVCDEPKTYLYFYTPEDILLQKLKWFRLGDEVSTRQWRDAIGIVMVQEKLDEAYMKRIGSSLGIEDLLERALAEGREA